MKIEEGYWAGWEVYIETRHRLREHKTVHVLPTGNGDARGKVTFFVECEGEEEFTIVVSRPPQSFEATLEFTADGRTIGYYAYLSAHPEFRLAAIEDFNNKSVVLRRLKFCRLNLTEDDTGLTEDEMKSMGSIGIRLVPVSFVPSGSVSTPKVPSAATSTVDEKAKKDIQLYVNGGAITHEWTPVLTYVPTSIPGPKYDINISYRTRAHLTAKDIIPTAYPAAPGANTTLDSKAAIKTDDPDKDRGPHAAGMSWKRRAREHAAKGERPTKRAKHFYRPENGVDLVDLTAESDGN